MKKITTYFLFSILFLGSFALKAQTVTNQTTLNSAIAAAGPGSTIILANGTWLNATISISKNGADGNPITIKAETPGMVFFTGNTSVKLGGAYIHFEGVVFKDAPATVSTGTALIDFRVNSSNVGTYCKLTNVKIDAFNQNTSQQTTVFKWILLRGHHNEISYSSFVGKHGVGSIINDNRDAPAIENYHKIHHNYFADRTPQGTSVVNDDNDQDAIRIGNSATSLENSFTEVYDNYFYNFVGEIEIISNKSGNNKYYNNTFEDYSGALTLRHGDNCEVYNNFFLANGQSFSGGVRVMGENHKIYNNYMEGTVAKYPNNSSTSGLAGINIHNGILNSPLNGYYQVKNATIVNNTFVNCDLGIRVGATFSSGTQNQPPQDVIIGNNIMYENTNRAIQVTTQLTGTSSKYENNIKQNGTFDSFGSIPATGNINVTSGLLTSGTDFYRIETGSDAIDYGKSDYTFLTEDITGGSRTPTSLNYDAGAEELNSGGARIPYKQSDVGVTVGFGASTTLSNNAKVYEKAAFKIYPVPTKDELIISSQLGAMQFLQIFDLSGKLLLKRTVNSNTTKIDVQSFSKGVYVLEVDGFKSRFVVK